MRVAVVTGAATGIGRAVAERLAREGNAVVIADLDEAGGPAAARALEREGARAAFVHADVARADDVTKMIRFTEDRFGGVDILVNNAGIGWDRGFPEAPAEEWRRVLDVNLYGVMLATQAAVEAMRRRGGGVIVTIASIAGVGYRPYGGPEYAASKAGVVRLTAALGHLAAEGIRVNCICPGWVATPKVREYLASLDPEERRAQAPAALIQPEQIADLVWMFVTDTSLAGRVTVWPDEATWQLIPLDAPW